MTEDELFLTTLLKCSRSDLFLKPIVLTPEEQKAFDEMRQRRRQGEPIQYICQGTEFLGHFMKVGPGVLIPRVETEVLVDGLLQLFKKNKITQGSLLDLGVGSGCIAIAILKQMPFFTGIGVDISSTALSFAEHNVSYHQLTHRLHLQKADMFSFLQTTEKQFDVIVSNPPYIPTQEISQLPLDVQQEPRMALDGGEDGLDFYRRMIPFLPRCLTTEGFFVCEFSDGQAKEIQNILEEQGDWVTIQVFQDLAGKERFLIARHAKKI